jgi:hypothetical protein
MSSHEYLKDLRGRHLNCLMDNAELDKVLNNVWRTSNNITTETKALGFLIIAEKFIR